MNIYISILAEFFLISSSILLLFNLRSKLGLAPLYILLGSVQYLQALSGTMVSFYVLGDIPIYPGSVIVFSAVLFAVLLIYIKEGASSARALIIGIIISNFILSALFGIIYVQEYAAQIISVEDSSSVFQINYKYFITGTLILLVDFIFLVIIYQFLLSKIRKQYFFFILFISLFTILIFDALAFNITLKYGSSNFNISLLGHIIGKSISSLVFSIVLYIYLKYIDNEKNDATFIAGQKRDIFSIVKYRKRYLDLKVEKKQVEEKLTSKLETALNNISDGFVSLDTNWCYIYVNKKAGEFLGRSPESLVGKNIWTEFPEGINLPFYKTYYKAVETQKTIYYEEYYEPMDKWFENRIYPSPEGLTIYFTDITEKRKAEADNQTLLSLIETSDDFIGVATLDGKPIYLNRSGRELVGLQNDAEMPESISGFFSDDYQETLANIQVPQIMQHGKWKGEAQFRNLKTSAIIPIEMSGFLIRDPITNEPIALGNVATDIAERKKAELALMDSENHLRAILETEPECIKQINAKGDLIYMNPAGLVMIEADNLELVKGQSIINLIMPHHQKAFKKLNNQIFKGHSGQLEFEIVGLKGTKRWLETHAVPFKDTDGKIISLLGVTRDVTKRKEAEEKLIKSEQLFRGLSANAPVAIYQTDKDGACNFVNEEWIKYSGLSFNESMGYGWSDAIHPEDRDRIINEWQKSILTEKAITSEYRLVHKNGEIRWLSSKTVGLFDTNNELYGYTGTLLDITEIKKAEEQIIKSEKYLENIINNIGDPVFVKDEKSKMLLANDALCSLFKLSRAEIIGKTLAENVPPEERESFLSIDKQVISSGIENVNEETLRLYENENENENENETRVISTKKTRFTDDSGNRFLIGTIRDITERKKAEEQLEEIHSHLNMAVESAKLGVWSLTFETGDLVWNSELFEIYGIDPTEFDNTMDSFKKVVHPDDLEYVMSQQGGVSGLEFRIIRPNKEVRFINGSVSPIMVNGEVIKLIGINEDITERKITEAELKKHRHHLEELVEVRTTELEKEKVKAQSADMMKSAFLAAMSHELRTPMNSIIGFTGILLKELAGPINDEQKKQLGMVKNSGEHLLGLINDILDISKIEAGKLKVTNYPFNYLTSLERTVDFLAPQVSAKGLNLITQIDEMEISLISDERRVEQILLNLLSNAIKFSKKGTILVKVAVKDDMLITQVIDQGIGISKKDLVKLFMPFIQLEGGLSRSHEGTGLGLAICKSLIEKLGGTIHVDSQLGKGSNFTFKLPLEYSIKE